MLILVATPIGNLADWSARAIETLQSCDLILCEDTRHSKPLLTKHGIDKPLRPYHAFNEAQSEEHLLEELRQGKTIGLISDAGTPGISDPGERLVARCRRERLAVSGIPGPSAAILALSLSGLPTQPFQFLGFLPKSGAERREAWCQALLYPGTTIFYETSPRIVAALEDLQRLAPTRSIACLRELTKLYEEWIGGTSAECLAHLQQHPPRGEWVFLIGPATTPSPWHDWDIKQLVAYLQSEFSLPIADAIKTAAQLQGLSKRQIYQVYHDLDN